jgi:hypothetical protein
MDVQPQSKRKRRIILLVAVLLCTAIGAFLVLKLRGPLGREVSRHRQAKEAAWRIEGLGGRVSWKPKSEIIETLYYDKALSRVTDVHFINPTFPNERWLVLKELPQHFGIEVHGVQFTDAGLEYLKQVPLLEYLVLNNTAVTDQGVAGLQETLPHLSVMYGYPGQPGYRHFPAKVRTPPLREQ